MAKFCYISLMLFGALSAQMLLGNLGLSLPFTSTVVFYLAVVYGWQRAGIAAAITGSTIDLLYGNSCYSALTLLVIVGFARWWLHSYDSRYVRTTIFPGAICGSIIVLPQMRLLYLNWSSMLIFTAQLIFFMVVTAILLPLTVIAMEKIARLTGMPLFQNAKTNLIHRKH